MALSLGFIANRTLGTGIGINIAIWVGLLIGFAAILDLPTRHPRSVMLNRLILVPAAAFAACAAWRDSPLLALLNIALSAACLALAAGYSRGGQPLFIGFRGLVGRMVAAGFHAAFGAPLLMFETKWTEFTALTLSQKVRGVIRGMILAGPFLLLFGWLFVSADAHFESFVREIFSWLPNVTVLDVVEVAIVAGLTAGFLRQYLWGAVLDDSLDAPRPPTARGLGVIEANTVLLSLNLLFAGFILTQLSHFFGGTSHLLNTAGLTSAEYARRGFFELVSVAAIALPLHLLLDWIVDKQDRSGRRLFRFASAFLVLLLLVVMVSALDRMRLYTRTYGLTELRLYVTAFIFFLGAVFVWFAATVLTGRRNLFWSGSLAIGCVAAVAVQALNPDSLIARTNLSRVDRTGSLDVQYLLSLGSEATPHLIKALPAMTPDERRTVAAYLYVRSNELADEPWYNWNLGRSRARATLEQSQALLKSYL